ncbi:hypothetical protein BDV95DRAFT_624683 [Massariosphaeria phaeospora]|uniref:Zn(2)-C6 fungal-type domain-containing protein n=1 Tax=Massariosphaeria phaeospora TaxID=100035 RepID=A0A7C8MVP0_9PLEO|nr:hypothetical protein BDV95DRAFT_624683 [Massariosphaeria phaeospora]
MAPRLSFMDLSVDIKTLIVQHVIRPTDLKTLCLVCKQLHEITVRQLYHEVTLDIGSPGDSRLGAFLNPKNAGLQHVRKLDLYLADMMDKCTHQLQQASFAMRMILELLPEDILEKFSWHPWSPFSGDNLVLLYKKQKRMKWMEGIAVDDVVLDQLQQIPNFDKVFENVKKLGLYPDSREVLDYCHFLLKNSPKIEKLTLHASFDGGDHSLSERELNDSVTGPGLITSVIFSDFMPFEKCTPMVLKDITLQKINLRYAATTYCHLIKFSTVRSLRLFNCAGADALLAELCKSTHLPDKLETLEFKHKDNEENDGLNTLDGFMCLVSGIKVLTIDITNTKTLPAAAGIIRHGKTLKSLNVHASQSGDEHIFDYAAFKDICEGCPGLEQISAGFPPVSLIRDKQETFINFENCLGALDHLVTLNITTWPTNSPSGTTLPRKIYEHLLQGLAQQGFERSITYAATKTRKSTEKKIYTSKLAIIAFGISDKVYDREDSINQIIFVKGKQVDPLGTESCTAIQMGWCLRKYLLHREPSPGKHRNPPARNMSQYPPPPTDEQYTQIYPSPSGAQLLDSPPHPHPHSHPHPHQHQQQLPYNPSNYPKIEDLNEVLQQQAQHANQLSDPRTHAPTHAPALESPKPNRLRKACDSCSIRKVKCDESGPPCKACKNLDIPCTFNRPSRRRGPPNKHAEAVKRRRTDGGPSPAPSTPDSPTGAAHALAQLSSHPPQLSAETICPIPTMNALIDDFFTYIHPLCPFPHEPSFREAWDRREDYSNTSFLALLASMVACLVASFPRKPRQHIRSQTQAHYSSHLALVEKCREVCATARGPGYLDRRGLGVYDACTSYFLGLTGAYIFQWRFLRLYFGECLTILRTMGLHKAQEQGYVPEPMGEFAPNFEGSNDFKLDKITEQIGRRLFWTVFVGARTMQQLGASFGELTVLSGTTREPLPPLPLEIDDACIYPQEIHAQPADIVPLISGFNTNVRIYLSYSMLSTAEMAFGVDELFDWDQQQKILEHSLQRCKQTLDSIPDVLTVHPKDGQNGRFAQRKQTYYPLMEEYVTARDPSLNIFGAESQAARRASQYEIQKANIYASHLSIRSSIVEKYFALLEKSNNAKTQQALQSASSSIAAGFDKLLPSSPVDAEALEKVMSAEREQVIKDLLVVLGSIDMINMEPNGDSFVSLHSHLLAEYIIYPVDPYIHYTCPTRFLSQNPFTPIVGLRLLQQTQKIRQIASTLLDVPKERKGSVALQHQEYLYKFLDILSKLSRVSPDGSDPSDGPVDEEGALRMWADLREYQLKFQEQGGIYGFS